MYHYKTSRPTTSRAQWVSLIVTFDADEMEMQVENCL